MAIRASVRRFGALLRSGLGLASRAESRDDIDRALARRARIEDERFKQIEKRQRELARLLTQVMAEQAGHAEHMGRVGSDVAAVLRRQAVKSEALPYPERLISQRFRGLSQNEEDGMTLALFDLIGHGSRRFAEIGAGTNGGNSGFLARECGWAGLMVDASSDRVKRLRKHFGAYPVSAVAEMVTRENVNDLLLANGLTGDIDLLSIDIDGNDYWVWQALTVASPRVVIVEYNAAWGARTRVVVPYDPQFNRHNHGAPRRYYGASLGAFIRLAQEKGYRFLMTEPRKVNAYFVRNDVVLPDQARPVLNTVAVDDAETPLFQAVRERGLPLVHLD